MGSPWSKFLKTKTFLQTFLKLYTTAFLLVLSGYFIKKVNYYVILI